MAISSPENEKYFGKCKIKKKNIRVFTSTTVNYIVFQIIRIYSKELAFQN